MTAAWAFVPGKVAGEAGGGSETADRIGPYTVLDGLAEGGMGRVFRAVNPETGKRLAIKVPRSSATIEVAALLREISALRCLGHPGIVRMLDHGVTAAEVPWMALELVRGRTLYDEIETLWRRAPAARPAAGGRLGHALAIAAELAAILEHVHEQGLVHRDLKPANVLLEDGGPSPIGPGQRRRVRLLDFGLACPVRSLRPTRDGDRLCIGTMHYAAPEQIAGEPLDGRTDLYSLGCVLYELVTGRRLFDGSSHEVAQKQLYFHPMSPSALVTELPWAVEDLILALLSKVPADRPPSAKIVARRLSGLIGARRLPRQVCTTSPGAASARPTSSGGGTERLFADVAVEESIELAQCVSLGQPRGVWAGTIASISGTDRSMSSHATWTPRGQANHRPTGARPWAGWTPPAGG